MAIVSGFLTVSGPYVSLCMVKWQWLAVVRARRLLGLTLTWTLVQVRPWLLGDVEVIVIRVMVDVNTVVLMSFMVLGSMGSGGHLLLGRAGSRNDDVL